MNTLPKLLIALAVLAAILALTIYVTRPHEPVHRGKRLSEWMEARPPATFTSVDGVLFWSSEKAKTAAQREAEAAVKAIETNAFPYLYKEFNALDVPGRRNAILWLRTRLHLRISPMTLEGRKMNAMTALQAMGTNSLPALITLMEYQDDQVRLNALFALTWWECFQTRDFRFNRKPDSLTRAVARRLKDRNPAVRMLSLKYFELLVYFDYATILPALIESLSDTDSKVAAKARDVLQKRSQGVLGPLRDQAERALSNTAPTPATTGKQ